MRIHATIHKNNDQKQHVPALTRIRSGYFLTSLCLALCVAPLIFVACGKKRAPVPPREKPPASVKDLKETIQGERLTLTWTAPSLKRLAGFYVYRSRTSVKEPVCKECPILFTRIATISLDTIDDTSRFSHSETLETGYHYIYKVAAYSVAGLVSNDSNRVTFTF